MLIHVAEDLIPLAERTRERALHYNGFKVGCVGIGGGKIYFGANFKPTQNAEPLCAEEQVMLQALEDHAMLHTMVIAGQPRKEDRTPTLHCCGERCRPKMKKRFEQGEVVSASTLIICVNSTSHVVEQFTLKSLFEAHGEALFDGKY